VHLLSVLAIFKNETMNFKEWLNHYLWQGVDHFYLIDNGSTDNPMSILQPYVDAGLVDVFDRPERYKQDEHYNEVFGKIREQTEWLMVVDLDEFLFGPYKPVVWELCNSTYTKFAEVVLFGWIIFGTSLKEHPKSLRTSLVTRHPGVHDTNKYIVKARYVHRLRVHWPETCGDKQLIHCRPNDILHLNHYVTQSWEYFSKVKMTRGDVIYPACDNIRTKAYFDEYNNGATEVDTKLKDLIERGGYQGELLDHSYLPKVYRYLVEE
jgi:hypothetical protein